MAALAFQEVREEKDADDMMSHEEGRVIFTSASLQKVWMIPTVVCHVCVGAC